MKINKLAAAVRVLPSLKVNCAGGVKANGTVVVPCTLIVSGVLNGALLLPEEYSHHIGGWNGRPVVVRHPVKNGEQVSIGDPELWDLYTVGHVFNARLNDARDLVADLHVDLSRLCEIGACELAERLQRGEVVEVSTGYFADDDFTAGQHDGVHYASIHRRIVPDHLALLPDETGACSVEDGCGTFNVNSQEANPPMKTNAERRALAKKLRANEQLTAKQYAVIEQMDDQQMTTAAKLIDAMLEGATDKAAPAAPDANTDGTVEKPETQTTALPGEGGDKDLESVVANRVDAALARRDLLQSLRANKACKINADKLNAMSLDALRALSEQLEARDDQPDLDNGNDTEEHPSPLATNAAADYSALGAAPNTAAMRAQSARLPVGPNVMGTLRANALANGKK